MIREDKIIERFVGELNSLRSVITDVKQQLKFALIMQILSEGELSDTPVEQLFEDNKEIIDKFLGEDPNGKL